MFVRAWHINRRVHGRRSLSGGETVVCGCVCVCVCATIRLNPQLSLTGLAERTAEVYHCLLIFSDSHQTIRAAGHSPTGHRGNRYFWTSELIVDRTVALGAEGHRTVSG